MKDRIKDLVAQAAVHKDFTLTQSSVFTGSIDLKKFASAIAEACAVAGGRYVFDRNVEEDKIIPYDLITAIKQHMGIKK